MLDWVVDGWPKGVTQQRPTLRRCVGRNVHPASLRGEGISLAVHDGGWQACRRATDGIGKRSEQRAAPIEGSKSLLPLSSSGRRGAWLPRRLWAPETAGSTPAGQIARLWLLGAWGNLPLHWSAPRTSASRFLASLMSSRPWVPIPPALLETAAPAKPARPLGGIASDAAGGRSSDEQSTRLSGERPPVRIRSSPLHFRGGCGVTAASEVVILEVPVRIRPAALSCGR